MDIKTKLEAEKLLLGCILKNPNCFEIIDESLSKHDFGSQFHGLIFQTCQDMYSANNQIDALTVSEKISETIVEFDYVYVAQLQIDCVSTANVKTYAEIVKNNSIERNLLSIANEITQVVHGEGSTTDKLNAVQSLYSRIGEHDQEGAETIGEIAKKYIFDLEENNNKKIGVLTGFERLDKRYNGFRGGDLVIIAARPGMGKTTLAMNIAENIMLSNKRVLVFSLEMSKTELFTKTLASVGRIPYQLIRNGELLASNYADKAIDTTRRLISDNLLIDDTSALGSMTMHMRARKIHRKKPIDLIIVDYLQLIQSEKAENRNQEIAKITSQLKRLAKELNIPVIAISQLNRNLESRQDKRPMMSDLRESGSIEQDADIVIFIYRESYYDKSSTDNTTEIITSKFRGGENGTDYLTANLYCCRFDGRAYDDGYVQPQKTYSKKKGYEY